MSDSVLVVGLGSNIRPHEHLKKALRVLKQLEDCRVLNVARIYESDPELPAQMIEYTAEAWNHQYLNSAVLLEVKNFEPNQFLKKLKDIELIMGRKPLPNVPQWAPREIDLDILYADGLRLESENLKIPHERLFSRPFALLPLLELVPAEKLRTELPRWALKSWNQDRPFNTQISKKYLWSEMMGILNLTEDSFSDGSVNNSSEKFKTNAQRLLQAGAQILDLGAESTRPLDGGVKRKVDIGLEIATLRTALGWLEELKQHYSNFKISIDSRHPEVFQNLFKDFKIDFINDVTGFRNPQMRELAAETQCQVIAMHSLSVPVVKGETIDPQHSPIDVLNQWWPQRFNELRQAGILSEQIIFDPGIGFGKTAEQNMTILKNIENINTEGCALLIGHSRKSFLQLLTDKPASERDRETARVTASLNKAFYNYIRVHDIECNKDALIGSDFELC